MITDQQLEAQKSLYESVIECMDDYYKDVVEKMTPCYIRKHWVKNKKRGAIEFLILFYL